MLRVLGRVEEAERLLKETVARAHAAGAAEGCQIRILNSLTGVLRQKIDNVDPALREAAVDECIASAQQLLERGRRLGPEGDWFAFTAMQNLANLALLRGKPAEAAEQCRQLLAATHNRLSDCHNVRVWASHTLAAAEAKLGETREPADLYLTLIDCVRATTGSSIPLVSQLSDAMPYLVRDERWSEGEARTRELIGLLTDMGGHVGTFPYEALLANFISHQQRLDEAESLFQDLFALQAEGNITQRVYLNLYYADHLTRRGQFEHAERILQDVMDTSDLEDVIPIHPPSDLVHGFIALYEAWGKPEKAEEYRRRH
jgi:hypothetical protein